MKCFVKREEFGVSLWLPSTAINVFCVIPGRNYQLKCQTKLVGWGGEGSWHTRELQKKIVNKYCCLINGEEGGIHTKKT